MDRVQNKPNSSVNDMFLAIYNKCHYKFRKHAFERKSVVYSTIHRPQLRNNAIWTYTSQQLAAGNKALIQDFAHDIAFTFTVGGCFNSKTPRREKKVIRGILI
jgi:hypothetical protein